MKFTSKLKYFFRKSPVFRWILGILLVGIAIFCTTELYFQSSTVPVISSINPSIGVPGDLIILKGKGFGEFKDINYVEFEQNNGRNKLTASSIISWSDSEIKLILPAEVKSGLVYVGNKDAVSNSTFFTNSTEIPVQIPENPLNIMPAIAELRADKMAPGRILTIKGLNFGNTREKSKILFTCNREIIFKNDDKTKPEDDNNSDSITASEENYEYIYWSDSEIQVKIPDGTSTGPVYVKTDKGTSYGKILTMDTKIGSKKYVEPKTYVIRIAVDIEDSSSDKDSQIILRCPRPLQTVSQPSISLTEYFPEPVISDFQHTVIHQTSLENSRSNKKKFYQNFAVTVYETNSKINQNQVLPYSSTTRVNLEAALSPDENIPSDNTDLIKLTNKIIGKETNPYLKAKLIYEYMLKEFTLLQEPPKKETLPVKLLKTKKGDAYDFAVIMTAMLRAAKIPALTDSGILVSPNLASINHWWCEFYLEDLGWIPCDIAIASGLEYQTWTKDINVKTFYFGNIDAQHVLFSRGWNEIKPGKAGSKTVQFPRSYALQTIWEEASGENIKYSSYWASPVVIGVY